jgi:heme-degrading monooxygenase HmoA
MHLVMLDIAVKLPGYVTFTAGPIAGSSWVYFSVKFETPKGMDDWFHHTRHKPAQDLAKTRWFSTYYIRKWRLPADGEPLGDRLLCEIELTPPGPLDKDQLGSFLPVLQTTLRDSGAAAFETLTGQYEQQPYQLAGPLDVVPQRKPVQYLLVTHWTSPADLKKWLISPAMKACQALGEVTTNTYVPIRHAPGTRFALREDGLQRDWSWNGP